MPPMPVHDTVLERICVRVSALPGKRSEKMRGIQVRADVAPEPAPVDAGKRGNQTSKMSKAWLRRPPGPDYANMKFEEVRDDGGRLASVIPSPFPRLMMVFWSLAVI